MQSLEFDDLRVEIFASHAPFFGSATRPQPRASIPTAPDASVSAQFVSPELTVSPTSTQADPPAVSFGLSAQAASSEPPASAAPNTPPIAPTGPVSHSSLATSMTQTVAPHSPAASAQTAPPRLGAVPIIYLHALEFDATDTGEIYELVSRGADFVLAAIYLNEAQWGEKLSPWAAKSPFKGVRDFAGGGAAHLEKFTDKLIPRIERHVFGARKPAWRACAGYSLAGLFSAYAAFASDKFQKIACVSASFWFGGFDAFVAAHSPQRGLAHVYASLGEAEMNPKNPRGALCGETARNFIAKCRGAGAKAELEQNPGGHMQDEIARISKALLKLVNS